MSDETPKQTEESPAGSAGTPAGEDFAAPASAACDSTEDVIRHLREQNRQLTEQMLRMKAEMENARKRMAREKEDFQQFAAFQSLKEMLPILDGFELALAAEGGGEDYRKGVEIIHLQFLGTLQRLGLEPIAAVGKQFDPNLHEAIATVETSDVPDGQVVDEMQRGFFYKNRLLRPSKVRVAHSPSA